MSNMPKNSKRSGFTLSEAEGLTMIEMLVVLSVVAILFGLGVLYTVPFRHRQTMEQAALEVRTAFEKARFSSASRVKPSTCSGLLTSYEVEIVPVSGAYRIWARCAPPLMTFENRLPKDISFGPGYCTPVTFSVLSAVAACGTVGYPIDIAVKGYGLLRTVRIDSAGNVSIL